MVSHIDRAETLHSWKLLALFEFGGMATGSYGSRRLEARVRIELTIEVLQTSALPLGYRALYNRP